MKAAIEALGSPGLFSTRNRTTVGSLIPPIAFRFFMIARYLVPASETLISCALRWTGKARSSYLPPPPARSWIAT